MKKTTLLLAAIISASALLSSYYYTSFFAKKPPRLYWFIPDGMRADPDLFKVFDWAKQGELPHLQRMLKEGAHGYSIPDFPSHTPTNFASLLTGVHPKRHGVADGPMHTEGHPLAKPSMPGFSSVAKTSPPVWKLIDSPEKSIVLLSVPGSTPPEIKETTIRGRWGGWGFDTHKVIYESARLLESRKKYGRSFKLFFLGSKLTQFVEQKEVDLLVSEDQRLNKVLTSRLISHGGAIDLFIAQTEKIFDRAYIKTPVEEKLIKLNQGDWSPWFPINLKYKDLTVNTQAKVKIIKIWEDGNFRVRVLYNNLNELISEPGYKGIELNQAIGPMTDFADNWPPQLIFEEEDKATFLDEMSASLDWHKKAASYIYKTWQPNIFIQDIYTPNQMLESRWWQKNLDDPTSDQFSNAMKDLKELYQGLDSIIGAVLSQADDNTYVVLSSDHGVCRLNRLVHLNNLFAQRGWLKFSVDQKNGEPTIDWKNTKVIYLKMAHIYINPNGLDGNWKRSTGPEYESLKNEVKALLENLTDANGAQPVVRVLENENAADYFNLPSDRIGDLVLEARKGYFWFEEVNKDLNIFSDPLTSGYKQTIDAKTNSCMWTPFVIWGPNIKKGFQIKEPISHVDQLPTILKALGEHHENINFDGRILNEIFN